MIASALYVAQKLQIIYNSLRLIFYLIEYRCVIRLCIKICAYTWIKNNMGMHFSLYTHFFHNFIFLNNLLKSVLKFIANQCLYLCHVCFSINFFWQ